ncbi:hypothetical protein PTTG_29071 [Puccinia triticina 1-1 BBBD Race 1]|uniref:Uncharacterized protein n=1 Tax=Puccinia triticina (isolate 1-1 / race 1 (BBBD)) TaxID=630390 RepID=A0A180G6J3_PUCT1|nr:hypothetical protein PTTG_29071 [Puccinia triticina 1-1 BBBD Race 1]
MSVSFLWALLARPDSPAQGEKVMINKMMMTLLLQLLDSKAEQKRLLKQTSREIQLAPADLRDLWGQMQTLEAGQLIKAKPLPIKTYGPMAIPKKAAPTSTTIKSQDGSSSTWIFYHPRALWYRPPQGCQRRQCSL